MKTKFVRKRNWLYEFLIILVIAFFLLAWYLVVKDLQLAMLGGSLTYLTVAWALRLTVNRHHREGIRCLKKKQYRQALECFVRSESFFTRYPWVDRFRVVTLFSSSAYTFREMAMQNQVHCLLRLDRPAEAIVPLKRLLDFAPGRIDAAELLEQLKEYLAHQTSA